MPLNLLDSPCHELSVIVGSSLFRFGVFLFAARDAYVLAGGGHIEQVVGPDFLAACAADRLENHYCLVSRILPSSSRKVRNGDATIFTGRLCKGMHALDADINWN